MPEELQPLLPATNAKKLQAPLHYLSLYGMWSPGGKRSFICKFCLGCLGLFLSIFLFMSLFSVSIFVFVPVFVFVHVFVFEN